MSGSALSCGGPADNPIAKMVVPQIVVIAEPGQGGAIVVDIATDAHAIGSEFASRNIFYSAISFGAAGVSFADVIGEIA
ncbi:MAG: hypothetical protein AB7V46_02505 [Thermomicrobiales bacterium]